MSTGANLRKLRCKLPKSRLRIESRGILSLRLSVWVGARRGHWREAARGHPPGNPQVEIRGALSVDLREHAGRGSPLLPRVRARSEHQFGPVMKRRDHAA